MRPTLEPDTLQYYKQLPVARPITLGDVPLSLLVQPIAEYRHMDSANPYFDAVRFYLMNHGIGMVEQQRGMHYPLLEHQPFVEAYYQFLSVESVRMFHYLLLIVIRELRHLHSSEVWVARLEEFSEDHQPERKIVMFAGHEFGSDTMNNVIKIGDDTARIDRLLELIVAMYETSGVWGSAYGGKKWAAIAKCLQAFVTGTISAEVMYDTAFSLHHNTGNIFNKGMIYQSVNDSKMVPLLDHQRAGLIPQYLHSLGEKVEPLIEPIMSYPIFGDPSLKAPVSSAALAAAKPVKETKESKMKPEQKSKPWGLAGPTAQSVTILPNVQAVTQ